MAAVSPFRVSICRGAFRREEGRQGFVAELARKVEPQQLTVAARQQLFGSDLEQVSAKGGLSLSGRRRREHVLNGREAWEVHCSNSEVLEPCWQYLKPACRQSTRAKASTSYSPYVMAEPDSNLPPFAESAEFESDHNGATFREEDDGAEVLIECRNIYKSFGDKHILRGASFKIRVGEAVGIIGPSGTGKSTVLRIMAGLLAPDSGEVIVCGETRQGLISDEDHPRLRIGLVFQSAALFDSLTVRENVGFMLYEHSDLSEVEIRHQVSESLAAVGLKGVEERLPSELSGGMKKRVALARAIISDGRNLPREREVVMYDEPTAGLDPIASTVVEDLIRSLHIRNLPDGAQAGKIASYIVVTHQHSTIRRAVDRLLFLHEGKVVWQGPTSEFDTTDNPIVRQFADGSLNGPIRY